MPQENEKVPLDTILSILENPIRRRILQKLSRDTNYPLQLSKELGVSQQAIMKHLKVLEDSDFVISYEERSDKGGPPRKVYSPRKRYCIRIDIGPSTYQEDYYSYTEYKLRKTSNKGPGPIPQTQVEIRGKITGEMKEEIAGALPAFTDPKLEGFRMDLEKIVNMESGTGKLDLLKKLISELNSEIDAFELRRKKMLAIRERVFEEANDSIAELSDDLLEREVLSMIVKDEISDVDILAELLDTRRINIEERMKMIRKRIGF